MSKMDNPSYHADRVAKRRKSKEGVIEQIFTAQKNSCKKRKHNLPTYDVKWLKSWLLNNPEFHRLYDIWVASGYDKWFKPSVDRLNDGVSYTEYNIQLLTWRENADKQHLKSKNGEDTRNTRGVTQFALDGSFIKRWYSISEASRNVGCQVRSIIRVCKGQRKSTGGFKWEY